LFAAGAIIARPESGLNIILMMALLIVAAILGDLVNYHIGDYVGPKAFSGKYKLLKKEYHRYKDSVFAIELKISASFPSDRKYSFSERRGIVTKVVKRSYTHVLCLSCGLLLLL